MFGLEGFSGAVNSAVAGSTSGDDLPGRLYGAVADWFSGNILPLIIGIGVFVAVIFVFYGAFLYFTAYGDENRAMLAKKTITYAFVGLIIVGLAFAIASFVQRALIRNEGGGIEVPTGPHTEDDIRKEKLF
ncbi:MAG: pilin [Candidatus Berkelbacteria bacterium]|nr:pilin [Candidatus Berkelbacteria bacterium]